MQEMPSYCSCREDSSQFTEGTTLLVIILHKNINDLDVQCPNIASLQCRGILGASEFSVASSRNALPPS